MQTTTKLHRYETGFTQVANKVLNDKRLSLQAKGLYAYLFSKPTDWIFHNDVILRELKETRYAYYKSIRELEKFNYLKREVIREGGKTQGVIINLLPLPFTPEEQVVEFEYVENQRAEKPPVEIRQHNNTDVTNTDVSNTKKDIYSVLSFIENEEEKELFKVWVTFKKEQFKFEYKSERSFKVIYDECMKMCGNDLEILKEMICRSLISGWKGIYALPQGYKPQFSKITVGDLASRQEAGKRLLSGIAEG